MTHHEISIPCLAICFEDCVRKAFENDPRVVALVDGVNAVTSEFVTMVIFHANIRVWDESTKAQVRCDFAHIGQIKYMEYLPDGVEINQMQICEN